MCLCVCAHVCACMCVHIRVSEKEQEVHHVNYSVPTYVSAKSLLLCLTLCDPVTVTHQAPLSMGFSRCKHWSRMPCPPPGDLSDPGIELTSLMSPALAAVFFIISATWEAHSVPELSLIISVFLVC